MISTIEKVLFLKGVDLFKTIPAEELSAIAQITDEVEYAPQQTVFKEGDQGDAMYLIVDGRVKIFVGERNLAELGTGQCFGEMAILDSEPRSATIVAQKDVVLLEISREDFYELMADEHEISQGIVKVLVRRLRNVKT